MRFYILLALTTTMIYAASDAPLLTARPLTAAGSFTEGIEGPATDRDGNLYVVNFARQGTIGRVTPDGRAEVFVQLPEGSIGNGIRFDRQARMYVADYAKHNILRIDLRTKTIEVFAHESKMNQPNDIAISPNGVLWASDPDWSKNKGQVWRIDTKGRVTLAAPDMGTANGIEVDPTGKILYVNETVQRKVWAFRIERNGALSGKRLLIEFPDHGMDGMRCDVDGNLYITRYGKGVVAVVSPAGIVLKEIGVLGKSPSNLCFGGPDGRTCYVTEVEHRRVVEFRTEKPGLEWRRWKKAR
jgi:sugar lactone lactonase YvrE